MAAHTSPAAFPILSVDDDGTGSGWHSLVSRPTSARHVCRQTSAGGQRLQWATHSLSPKVPSLPPKPPTLTSSSQISPGKPGAKHHLLVLSPTTSNQGGRDCSSWIPLTEGQKARQVRPQEDISRAHVPSYADSMTSPKSAPPTLEAMLTTQGHTLQKTRVEGKISGIKRGISTLCRQEPHPNQRGLIATKQAR